MGEITTDKTPTPDRGRDIIAGVAPHTRVVYGPSSPNRDAAAGVGRLLVRLVLIVAFGAVGVTVGILLLAPAGNEAYQAGDLYLSEEGDPVALPELAKPSVVFAADDVSIGQFTAEIDRTPVTLDHIPMHVRQAVLAIEDDRFYDHQGVEFASIARALMSNVESGAVRQGGSTITQQVVKNTFLLDGEGKADQTMQRKVKEALIAVRLERRFSKDQILERYFNTVYLGQGKYGFEAGSRHYFGKSVAALNMGEGAMLAGLIASPATRDPFEKPTAAIERRDQVLKRMVDLGWLDTAGYEAAALEPAPTEPHTTFAPSSSDYFIEQVKQILLDTEGILPGDKQERTDQVFYAGYNIYTTLDRDLQAKATQSIESNAELQAQKKRLTETRGYTAAIATVDTKTGAVRALYGGSDFNANKFDLASQSQRQTGSTMKIFGLVAALEQGYSPYDIYDGTSGCRYKGDRSGKGGVSSHGGPMTLWEGTVKSSNCVFVNLVNEIGPQAVVDEARKLGVDGQLDPNPAIILGGLEKGVSPLAMASGFATIASGGTRHETHMITRITDAAGVEIYRAAPATEQVLDPNVANTAVEIMRGVLTNGTAAGKGISMPAFGKTGTTQDLHDAWFIGGTRYLTTAVWYGNPFSSNVVTGFYGGDAPASMWRSFMSKAHDGLAREDFPEPNLDDYRKPRKIGKFRTPNTTRSNERVLTPRQPVPPHTTPPVTHPEPGPGPDPEAPVPVPVE